MDYYRPPFSIPFLNIITQLRTRSLLTTQVEKSKWEEYPEEVGNKSNFQKFCYHDYFGQLSAYLQNYSSIQIKIWVKLEQKQSIWKTRILNLCPLV